MAQYESNPQMPLSDAVEMKQDINSFFNPKKFDQGSKSPYFQIGSALNSEIGKAAEVNPIFGQAKDLADRNYVNNVALPFHDNELLKPFWHPEDYYAAKSVENGPAEYLPDATVRRANQMVANVKDPDQLNAITRIMPADQAAAFRQAVLNNATAGGGGYRIGEIGNAIGQPFSAPKHIFNAIKGQPYDDVAKALIGAAKQDSPTLNTTYQSALENLKNSMPQQPAEAPPLQLTYKPQPPQQPEMLASRDGVRPASPDEMAANEQARQQRAMMGIYPAQGVANAENIAPAQAAALKGASPMLQQYGSAKLLGNENMPPIADNTNTAGMLGNAELIKAQRMAENQKLADMLRGHGEIAASNQITPDLVEDIFRNRLGLNAITGQQPKNPAMAEALLKAFSNGKSSQ